MFHHKGALTAPRTVRYLYVDARTGDLHVATTGQADDLLLPHDCPAFQETSCLLRWAYESGEPVRFRVAPAADGDEGEHILGVLVGHMRRGANPAETRGRGG